MELVERVQELRKDIELGLKTDVVEVSVELIKIETELKQLLIQRVSSSLGNEKTKISDWDKLDWCNVRLRNNLFVINRIVNGKFETIEYIEDITKRWFMKSAGIGIKSWREFVELRGY